MSADEIHDGRSCVEHDATFRLLLKRVPTLNPNWENRGCYVSRSGDHDYIATDPNAPSKASERALRVLQIEAALDIARGELRCALECNLKLTKEASRARSSIPPYAVMRVVNMILRKLDDDGKRLKGRDRGLRLDLSAEDVINIRWAARQDGWVANDGWKP